MKKLFIIFSLMLGTLSGYATEEAVLQEQNSIQSRINRVGTEILNSNKIEKRIIFANGKEEKIGLLKGNKTLTKRQVIVYDNIYKQIETDDELAGFIAREIALASRSYDGLGDGWLSSVKIKAAPKKYELVFDKLAVDYMVKAGYNPLGLIILINKTCPQVRQDKLSSKNLTSKRLGYIYERIYSQYPSFLVDNEYLTNTYYQNFLLTSLENRKIAKKKVENPSANRKLKYE
ncbi:hypothetical protein IJD34_07380 [bacterium]|nr:hypothetical protein [bacterium]